MKESTMLLQNDILRAAIKNNRTVMLLGKSGTAKSAIVNYIASELGFPVVSLPLAGISPEDIGGIPRPNHPQNPTAFRYLAPEWFENHRGKPFVLFLDEFNQATIDTMHAMFYLVNDRMTAGQINPEMRIVAAGNTESENEFLTPIPLPLKDRFVYQIKWQSDLESSLKYLEQKYTDTEARAVIKAVRNSAHAGVTARHVEQAICMVLDGIFDVDRGKELIGSAYELYIEGQSARAKNSEDDRLQYVLGVKQALSKKYNIIDGKLTVVNHKELLATLTDEEREIVQADRQGL